MTTIRLPALLHTLAFTLREDTSLPCKMYLSLLPAVPSLLKFLALAHKMHCATLGPVLAIVRLETLKEMGNMGQALAPPPCYQPPSPDQNDAHPIAPLVPDQLSRVQPGPCGETHSRRHSPYLAKTRLVLDCTVGRLNQFPRRGSRQRLIPKVHCVSMNCEKHSGSGIWGCMLYQMLGLSNSLRHRCS